MTLLTTLLMALALANPKVAITSTGPKPESKIASQFARAPWFMIYDSETRDWQPVDNSEVAGKAGGAGREAAEALARRGVKIVVTGQCGPNARRALSSAGIKIFEASDRTVREALRDYEARRLRELK